MAFALSVWSWTALPGSLLNLFHRFVEMGACVPHGGIMCSSTCESLLTLPAVFSLEFWEGIDIGLSLEIGKSSGAGTQSTLTLSNSGVVLKGIGTFKISESRLVASPIILSE